MSGRLELGLDDDGGKWAGKKSRLYLGTAYLQLTFKLHLSSTFDPCQGASVQTVLSQVSWDLAILNIFCQILNQVSTSDCKQ